MTRTVALKASTHEAALRMQWVAIAGSTRLSGVMSRARTFRLAVVLATIPVLAWLAQRWGVDLRYAICALMAWGPIAWVLLGLLFAGVVARSRIRGLQGELRDVERARPADPSELGERDVTLEVTEADLVFRWEGGERRYTRAQLVDARDTAEALFIVFADHTAWRISAQAFASPEARSNFANGLK